MKISLSLGVNLRTAKWTWKELDKFNGDYKGTTAQKFHSDHFDLKRTKFLGEIQAIISNNPSCLIRSIAKEMGVSKFFIRQVGHEDIWYFLYKMRKDHFFITDHERKEERLYCKAFQQTQAFPLTKYTLVYIL